MTVSNEFAKVEPLRAHIDASPGARVIEFGTPWCGYCRAAQPLIAEAFSDYGSIEHLKVEDGKGKPLGRSFQVKLWPTLIFMRDGREVLRLVRPASATVIGDALKRIAN